MKDQAEIVTVRMSRGLLSTTWGFQITSPLIINNIVPGSLAERAGLVNGDKIIEMEGQEHLDLELARQLLSKAQHKLELIVYRTNSGSGQTRKSPKETEGIKRFQHSYRSVYERENEANSNEKFRPIDNQQPDLNPPHQSQIFIPGFNTTAQPFGNHQEVKHLQYNSPMPLYSPQSAAEQYLQQTGGLFGTDPNLNKPKNIPRYLQSETLRLIQETEKPGEIKPPRINRENDIPVKEVNDKSIQCFVCSRDILGRVSEVSNCLLHEGCFQCSTCGSKLSNERYHFINSKFYCDIHGSQLKGRAITSTYTDVTRGGHSITTQAPKPVTGGKETYLSSTAYHREYVKSPTLDHNATEREATRLSEYLRNKEIKSTSEKSAFCQECKRQIRGAYVLAEGLTWCPEHFVCANKSCGRKLLEIGFIEDKGKKYCETCFENIAAPKCSKCYRPITADCLNALQKQWHPECFACAHCKKPFGNSAFFLEQGLPYCEKDWNSLFTSKCVACKFPIEAGDRWVEALGSAYHSNCFNCARCHANLEGASFYAKDGSPYCKLHA